MRDNLKKHVPAFLIITLAVLLFGVLCAPNAYGISYQNIVADGTCHTGTVGDDAAYYHFKTTANGTARVGVSCGCSGVSMQISTSPYMNYSIYQGKDTTMNLAAGDYYVKVSCSAGHTCTNPFEISANFKAMTEYDQEPNNSMDTAIVMTSGKEYKGHAYYSFNDRDWYKLVVKTRSVVHFYLDQPSGVTGFMYDEDGNPIDVINGCASGLTQVKYYVEPGTYYIEIQPAYQTDRNYIFSARIVERPTINKIKSITTTAVGKAKITWTESKYAEGYLLYKDVNTERWSYVANIPAGTLSYTDNNAPYPGVSCIYHVCGYRYDKKDPYNPDLEILSEETNDGKLYKGTIPTPKNVKVTKYTSSIKVSWSKSAGAQGYKVYRKANGGKYKFVKTIKSNGTLSWSDTTVAKGTNYKYKVRAYYYSGKTYYSSYSGETSTAKLTGTIAAPKSVSAKYYGKYNKVSWAKVKNVTGYKVYRKVGLGSYKLVKTTTSTSFKDTSVKKGKKYTYKVKAYYQNYTYQTSKKTYTYKTVNSLYSKTASVKR